MPLKVETKKEAFDMLNAIPKHTRLVVDFTDGKTDIFLYKAPYLKIKPDN